MSKTSNTMMLERLQSFEGNTPDIEASAVVSVDGLTIASSFPNGVEDERVSAMSASMLNIGKRISSELDRGMLDEVYVQGDDGYILLMSMGNDALLSVMAHQRAKLGLVFLEMRKAISDLGELVRI
jgi:predicted regulator of Ras-like GTPase activity (Roadblock/LC7/MglB family)